MCVRAHRVLAGSSNNPARTTSNRMLHQRSFETIAHQDASAIPVATAAVNKLKVAEYVSVVPPTAAPHDPKLPAVLLFGWAGCTDNHLAKYSRIYEDLGCLTLRYTAPARSLVGEDYGNAIAKSLCASLLRDRELDKRANILVHSFSNNGARVMYLLQQQLQRQHAGNELYQRMKGIIFDSGPCSVTQYQKALAVTSIQYGTYPPMLQLLLSYWLFVEVCLGRGLLAGDLKLSPHPNFIDNWQTQIRSISDQLPRKQLFLYSKTDAISAVKKVEDFVKEQKRHGHDVSEVKFDQSEHCKHLRAFPTEYKTAIAKFIQENYTTKS